MIGFGHGYGHGFMSIIGMFMSFALAIFVIGVALGLIILLVRFLLVATRAAQLYVAAHEPPRSAAPPAPPAPAAPAAKAPATAAPSTPVDAVETQAKPATKPRTPRTPPTE